MRLTCGLEIHAQIKSAQKLFSHAKTSFKAQPNSNVSFFDAALPGTQPKLNWQCVNQAMRAAAALNAEIQPTFAFDRKHYMYPDQPAGYQITQNFYPYAKNGYLELLPRDLRGENATAKKVRIKQLQMEQDTGKSMYTDVATLVDLNRCNSALIEIVTEPDLESAEEAYAFVKKLQTILRFLSICTGEMETGAMRVDVNVSVDMGNRCEIKNLFSTSAVLHAIKAEYERQVAAIKAGETIYSETRGWDGQKTWKLRGKEGIIDYRYMPDPELPLVVVPSEFVGDLKSSMADLPDVGIDKLMSEHKMSLLNARTIVDHGAECHYFYKHVSAEFVSKGGKDATKIANVLVNRWLAVPGRKAELPPAALFIELMLAQDQGRVSSASVKILLRELASLSPSEMDTITLADLMAGLSENTDALDEACQSVVAQNQDAMARIRSGNKGAIGFLVGQVMKQTKGVHDPVAVRGAIEAMVK